MNGRLLVAAWGVLGIAVLLGQAVVRLGAVAFDGVHDLSALQWSLLVGWIGFNAYVEGWRGFHRRFSPRVVARALHLARTPRLGVAEALLAPAFCMSFFGATRRGMTVAWGLTAGIVVLVIAVRQLEQPWRGIVDAGVVVGLALGLASIGWFVAWALVGREPGVDHDLPGG